MRMRPLIVLLLVATPVAVGAHHGSAISYDTTHLWTTWATVTEFEDRCVPSDESLFNQFRDHAAGIGQERK